ncbi:MAG: glycosyltransferase family 2 protein [Gammaproteobacteria bacterium]|nr:glycosyltransferase family 2 protein [Gammaproteobacteria bacterium]
MNSVGLSGVCNQRVVWIIIPVHNRLSETKKCLEAIYCQTYRNYRTIIVDDGSTDGTRAWIETFASNVKLLHGDGNLWWSGATNEGLRYVLLHGGLDDYVLTLNDDVQMEPDTLERLVTFSGKKDELTVVSALCVDRALTRRPVISSGVVVRSWILNWNRHPFVGVSLIDVPNDPISVDLLNGRCVLHPLRAFSSIGLYNRDRFPQYGGDNEFSRRLAINGYSLFILPTAVANGESSLTGLNPGTRRLNLKEILLSFSSLKSVNNLKIRFWYALVVPPWYAKPTFMLISYLKLFVQIFMGNIIYSNRVNLK